MPNILLRAGNNHTQLLLWWCLKYNEKHLKKAKISTWYRDVRGYVGYVDKEHHQGMDSSPLWGSQATFWKTWPEGQIQVEQRQRGMGKDPVLGTLPVMYPNSNHLLFITHKTILFKVTNCLTRIHFPEFPSRLIVTHSCPLRCKWKSLEGLLRKTHIWLCLLLLVF